MNNSHDEPRFLGVAQFVALVSLLPAIVSYSVYGLGALVFDPYYLVLPLTPDGSALNRTFQALTQPIVFAEATWGPSSMALYVLSTLAAIGCLVYAAFGPDRRPYLRQMAGAMAVPVAFLLSLAGLFWLKTGDSSVGTMVCFVWAPKIALLWFALRGRILSKATALFVLFTVFWSISNLNYSFAGSGGFFFRFNTAPRDFFLNVAIPLLTFFLATLLIRLVILAVISNAYLLRRPGVGPTLRNLGLAAVYWIPMLVLSAPYFAFEHYVEVDLNETLRKTPPGILLQKKFSFAGDNKKTFFSVTGETVYESRPIAMMTLVYDLSEGYLGFYNGMENAKSTLNGLPDLSTAAADQLYQQVFDVYFRKNGQSSCGSPTGTHTRMPRRATHRPTFRLGFGSTRSLTSGFRRSPRWLPPNPISTPIGDLWRIQPRTGLPISPLGKPPVW